MKSAVGFALGEVLYFCTHNVHYMFIGRKGYEEVARDMSDKIHYDSKLVGKFIKEQHIYGARLVAFAKKAGNSNLERISNQTLYEFFADYEKKYKEVYARYGWIWITEDHYIADLLRMVEGKVADKRKAAVVLDILTREPSAMVATVELKALFELALRILADKHWVSLVTTKDIDAIKKDSKLSNLIRKHERNYFWVTRDYEDSVLDFRSIVQRLTGYLILNVRKEYEKLVGNLAKNESERKRYLARLNFSKQEQDSFNSMRHVAYLKELRKRYVSESLYYFDSVLKEIGRRFYLSLNQVRHLKIEEIRTALIKGKELSFDINERIELMLWYCRRGQPMKIVERSQAERLFNLFCKVDKNAKEFTGMPVSPGVAKGPARVILHPDECDKVQKGDIIVSIQVVPSFSTAIMKAAGLVCDGGHGITTHPATLAREAKIPGVIQTRFVREVVKDGDWLEVDGYKGVVRRI